MAGAILIGLSQVERESYGESVCSFWPISVMAGAILTGLSQVDRESYENLGFLF